MLYYNSEESALRSILRWSSTLTMEVLTRSEFWIYNGLTVSVTVLIDQGLLELGEGLKSLNIGSLLGPIMTLAVFTAVFYNGQCYSRYLNLYGDCMQIDTSVKMLVNEILVDFGFDKSLRCHLIRISKYILASIFVFHLSLEQQDGLGMSDRQWNLLMHKGLLNKEEVDFVRAFPCHHVVLLQYWALKVVNDCVDEAAMVKKYTPPERAALTSRVFGHITGIGIACRKVDCTLNLPIPFQYFHLLQMTISSVLFMVGMCVCVLAANADGNTYCVAVFPFAVVSFVLLALRTLSGQLADPFGSDVVDFPSTDFMREVYDHSVAMLLADLQFTPAVDLSTTKEFTQKEVELPCQWTMDSLDKEMQSFREMDIGDDTKHGTRLWCRPEDVFSAARVGRWISSFNTSDTVPKAYHDKNEDEFGAPRVDELSLAVLERVDSKLQQLLSVMSGGNVGSPAHLPGLRNAAAGTASDGLQSPTAGRLNKLKKANSAMSGAAKFNLKLNRTRTDPDIA